MLPPRAIAGSPRFRLFAPLGVSPAKVRRSVATSTAWKTPFTSQIRGERFKPRPPCGSCVRAEAAVRHADGRSIVRSNIAIVRAGWKESVPLTNPRSIHVGATSSVRNGSSDRGSAPLHVRSRTKRRAAPNRPITFRPCDSTVTPIATIDHDRPRIPAAILGDHADRPNLSDSFRGASASDTPISRGRSAAVAHPSRRPARFVVKRSMI